MSKKNVLVTTLAVIFAAFGLTACGHNSNSSSATSTEQAPKAQQHMTWVAAGELTTIDLSKATDAISFAQLNNVMEGLYYLGPHAVPKNALATNTKVSNDNKTWTFTLKKNAKWSNGDPITAQDFVYSWQRTVNPKTESEYSYLFAGIKNANNIVAGKKKVNSLGIKAVGKHKIIVNLDKQIPYFKILLTFPTFFPQDQKAVAKGGSKYGTQSKYMVYDGPYVQKGWDGSNLSWQLVKNQHYWDKKAVKLNHIDYSVQKEPSTSFNLYQAGQVGCRLFECTSG